VVDFAYHVHTDVGNHMKAAKVNGKPVHSDYALKNAEVRSLCPVPGISRTSRRCATLQ
jgi:(p)ppGpp synthase/HD superfamily hydrolase